MRYDIIDKMVSPHCGGLHRKFDMEDAFVFTEAQ